MSQSAPTHLGFPSVSAVKNQPGMQKTPIQSLGWEDPLEEEMTTHSSILAWRIPWTEEPGGLQPVGSQRVNTTEEEILHKEHFRDEKASFKMYSIPFLDLFKNRVGEAADYLTLNDGSKS